MGCWIGPEGKAYPNPDHWLYMKAHPRRFGFTVREALGWEFKDRERLLDAALDRGWIRVRGERPHLAFMFSNLDEGVVKRLDIYLRPLQSDPKERCLFEATRALEHWYEPFDWITGGGVRAALGCRGNRQDLPLASSVREGALQ